MATSENHGMHVLHVTNDFRDNGTGITNMLRVLVIAQRRAGLDVTVASEVSSSSYIDELTAHGVRFQRFERISSPLFARRLARQLNETGADVVHVHTGRTAMALALADPSLRRRSVATVHNVFQLSSVLMASCAAVVCISAASRKRFMRIAPWTWRRLIVIHNAIALEQDARRSVTLPPRSIVYVGGLHHRKGVDILIEAVGVLAAEGVDVELLVYGNRDEPALEKLAAPLVASGHVRFMGFSSNPRSVMASARVVAVPSRDEPFGLVAVEARASGAAIVASDVGGLREALDDGKAGVLVKVGDVPAWAAALRRVLDDDDHRDDLIQRASAGLGKFAPDAVCEAYAAVYRKLPRSPARTAPSTRA